MAGTVKGTPSSQRFSRSEFEPEKVERLVAGLPTSRLGTVAIMLIGVKSVTGSNGSLG
jgi:hypothetical protein